MLADLGKDRIFLLASSLGSIFGTQVVRVCSNMNENRAWATLVCFLGRPALPEWAQYVFDVIESEKRITPLDGIGCQPVSISATTEEVLQWIGDGLKSQLLNFPEKNGAIG
jgi:hypothetical protein